MKMKFYDEHGSTLGWIDGLTQEEVDTIYKGFQSVLKKAGCQTGFNASMPTVWNEETGERVSGY